ncbi:piggyBac transposable element-derived protein 3-like [Chelonus insularis]|uniref:piggyBac transposable element-derived protein 3-like n=1 Tax=Chelonus insularis TaxID=460826 RepID=UPI00158DD4AB|nr:piggyBac transposable element-derived protein 3-like [Chelonus insularis]
MDSKLVSIVSTAAGVTPLLPSMTYSSAEKSRIEKPFPQAFYLYNQFMGGVGVHDGHCNNVLPSMHSKKWTWVVFMRLIQAAIVNSLVIYNAAGDSTKKVGSKEFAMSIAKNYIRTAQTKRRGHTTIRQSKQKRCSNCPIRTNLLCNECA